MKTIFLFILALLITLSCKKQPDESNSFNDYYSFMYGDWTPVMIDTWSVSKLTSYGNTFQFLEKDRYMVFRNDSLIEKGNIDILCQDTTSLEIRFIANIQDQSYNKVYRHISGFLPLQVTVFNNDSIRMNNNATDGGYFSIWFSRKCNYHFQGR